MSLLRRAVRTIRSMFASTSALADTSALTENGNAERNSDQTQRNSARRESEHHATEHNTSEYNTSDHNTTEPNITEHHTTEHSRGAQHGGAAETETSELKSFAFGRTGKKDAGMHESVEFVGGPLDGYWERLPFALDNLALTIAIPISPTYLTALGGKAPPIWKSKRPTSVAFYELGSEPVPPRYLFLGSVRPQDVKGLWTSAE